MKALNPITPEVGDYVVVPGLALITGTSYVVGVNEDGRATVQSVQNPNITVTLASRTRVYPEQCVLHSDCRATPVLAVECARATRWAPRPLTRRASSVLPIEAERTEERD